MGYATYYGDSRRWREGSKKRIELRRACEANGLCTTCFGKGRWPARLVASEGCQVVIVICTNCRGTGRPQGSSSPSPGSGNGAA